MALDRITLGSPKPANDFEAYQRSVEAWAREVEQAVRTLESYLRTLGVNLQGYGSPEGVVTAPVGTGYLRLNGGTSTTLYVKESGVGNIGWVAK